MKQLMGTGLLSWPRQERQSGRYGLVALFDKQEMMNIPLKWILDVNQFAGKRGMLVAEMDGVEYDLGAGTFFTEDMYGGTYVGLKPDDDREEDWLNVTNLYKVDWMLTDYTPVNLYFVATE